MKGFVQKGEYYESEVVFDRNGKHNLLVQVEDMAGNASISEEKVFKIDMKKPEIYISGIKIIGPIKHL